MTIAIIRQWAWKKQRSFRSTGLCSCQKTNMRSAGLQIHNLWHLKNQQGHFSWRNHITQHVLVQCYSVHLRDKEHGWRMAGWLVTCSALVPIGLAVKKAQAIYFWALAYLWTNIQTLAALKLWYVWVTGVKRTWVEWRVTARHAWPPITV